MSAENDEARKKIMIQFQGPDFLFHVNTDNNLQIPNQTEIIIRWLLDVYITAF